MRELREVDALAARERLVGTHDRERQRVEVVLELRVADARHDLGDGSRREKLPLDLRLGADLSRLGQDSLALRRPISPSARAAEIIRRSSGRMVGGRPPSVPAIGWGGTGAAAGAQHAPERRGGGGSRCLTRSRATL